MSEKLSDSDRHHLRAWADTGDGYTIELVYLVRCLWCDYQATGTTAAEATRRYLHEHESVIQQRADDAHRDFIGGG